VERGSGANADAVKRSQRVAIYLLPGFDLLLFAGAFGAALSWRPGAFLLLIAAAGLLTTHLFIGVSAYRETMNRPWPPVQPLAEDDDDW
jgi:hypothetical protein